MCVRQGNQNLPVHFLPNANIDQLSNSRNDSSEDKDDKDKIDINGVYAMDKLAAATSTELLVQEVNNIPLVPLL